MPLKVKNIAAGFYDSAGRFHPIRASEDYDPDRAGEFQKYHEGRYTKGEERALAEQAAYIARESRKKRAAKKKKAAKKKTAKKRAATKKAAISTSSVKQAIKNRKNPIPVDRYVPARVKRTRSGDIKIMLPLR